MQCLPKRHHQMQICLLPTIINLQQSFKNLPLDRRGLPKSWFFKVSHGNGVINASTGPGIIHTSLLNTWLESGNATDAALLHRIKIQLLALLQHQHHLQPMLVPKITPPITTFHKQRQLLFSLQLPRPSWIFSTTEDHRYVFLQSSFSRIHIHNTPISAHLSSVFIYSIRFAPTSTILFRVCSLHPHI